MRSSNLVRNVGACLCAASCWFGPILSKAAVISVVTQGEPKCWDAYSVCGVGSIADTFESGQSGDTFEWIIHLPIGQQMTLTAIESPAYLGGQTEINNTSGGGSFNVIPRFALATAFGVPMTPFATGNTISIDWNTTNLFGLQTVAPTSWKNIPFQTLILQYETVPNDAPGNITVELTMANVSFERVHGLISQVPEPQTILNISSGIVLLMAIAKRKKLG